MASIAAAVSVPTFSGLKAESKAAPAQVVSSSTVVRMAPVRASASNETLKNVGKALFAASSSLLLAASANAATVKMGGNDGTLGFYPSSISVAAGESITFVNNKGFPHNVVFDEDAVPAGVTVDAYASGRASPLPYGSGWLPSPEGPGTCGCARNLT